MTQRDTENTAPTSITAENFVFTFLRLNDSISPQETDEIIKKLKQDLDSLTPKDALKIRNELDRQRGVLEIETNNAVTQPIDTIQYVVENQFRASHDRIQAAEDKVEAARALAQPVHAELLQLQQTLLEETLGENSKQRVKTLACINQAIGAVSLKIPTLEE